VDINNQKILEADEKSLGDKIKHKEFRGSGLRGISNI
jgi:hypothetical protein